MKNLIGQSILNVDQIVNAELKFGEGEESSAFEEAKRSIVAHKLLNAKFKVGQFVDFRHRSGQWVEGQI